MGPGSIPTGELHSVLDTPIDFTVDYQLLGQDGRLAVDNGGNFPGLDHAFIVERSNIDSIDFVEVGAL